MKRPPGNEIRGIPAYNPTMMEPAIAISDLDVRLDGKTLFSGFSVELPAGQKAVIVGESGAGKSTLLNCIMGFVRQDAGEIRVDGVTLTDETIWEARRRMAFVQQEPAPGEGPVRRVLARPFAYHGNRDLVFDADYLDELMERFRLPKALLDKDFRDLSGGERQRAAIIAALLLKRPVLLLDEVSSALDEDNTAAVVDFLASLEETTVLAVAHDRALRDIADRLITLNGDAAR